AGGRPFALAEHHHALHLMATARLHDPEQYWEKLKSLPDTKEQPPAGARKVIARTMPERGLKWRLVHRVAGLGSLGRARYVGLADWNGGSVAREAKALAPSACAWAEGVTAGETPILYPQVLKTAVRCPD